MGEGEIRQPASKCCSEAVQRPERGLLRVRRTLGRSNEPAGPCPEPRRLALESLAARALGASRWPSGAAQETLAVLARPERSGPAKWGLLSRIWLLRGG